MNSSVLSFDAEMVPSLWIFGYGSLIWNTGFEHSEASKGEAPGFARVFWQGNTMHRGDDQLPGRVVTIVEDSSSSATGLALRVSGYDQIKAAFKHLYYREIENGYQYEAVTVDLESGVSIRAITVVARPSNEFYLGPQTTEQMANQIATAKGVAGPNSEYLLKLAHWNRKLFPQSKDNHLYELETAVLSKLNATLSV